jgi:hypothetical protein
MSNADTKNQMVFTLDAVSHSVDFILSLSVLLLEGEEDLLCNDDSNVLFVGGSFEAWRPENCQPTS